MPLMQKKSKKAFEHNIKAEMDAGKPQPQALAIAYSVKRKPKKKMANGGEVSAKTEKRPMPDDTHDDAVMVSHNSAKKAIVQGDWTDQPTMKQASKGPKTTAIKHPRMAASNVLQTRLRDDEDHLQSADEPSSPDTQPPMRDNEEAPKRMGRDPDMPKPHTTRTAYAKGGSVSGSPDEDEAEHAHLEPMTDMEEGAGPEEDMQMEPAGLQEDDDQMRPAKDEYMAGHFARGGEVSPQDEIDEDHHDSVAAAIMSKKRKMAEGGQVDLDLNAEEQPNEYYDRNENAALKENYDEPIHQANNPMDSAQHGDSAEADLENIHDMISTIRRKMAMKRQFGAK